MSPSRGKLPLRPLPIGAGAGCRAAVKNRKVVDVDPTDDCHNATASGLIGGDPDIARVGTDGWARGGAAHNFNDLQLGTAMRPLLGSLLGVARRILHDSDLARDAVQEALISLWLEHKLPPNPPAWLVRAVVLRSLQMNRGRARRRKHEGRACLERVERTDRDDPARILETRELRETLLAAIRLLPEMHREVFTLRIVEEMDYESIALELQIPVGTVRSRLSRSRNEIRRVVQEILSDELAVANIDPCSPERT
jgi:RNA polymerase sigma-70 factor, ECF subfamily